MQRGKVIQLKKWRSGCLQFYLTRGKRPTCVLNGIYGFNADIYIDMRSRRCNVLKE